MRQRLFTPHGPSLGAVGLGCMGMSWGYAESSRDDAESAAVISAALDAGISMIDTADIYGDGHNETVVAQGIKGRRDEVFLATKCGLVVDDLPRKQMHRDGSPRHIAEAVRASLTRLDVDNIDLLYLHRVDPAVPLEDTFGAMALLVEQGLVKYLGLSEVTVWQAGAANAIHPVSAVQSELSLWTRDALGSATDSHGASPAASPPGAGASVSGDVVGWCRTNGAAFVPFAPLGRGFLTGAVSDGVFEDGDFRATNPRFARHALTQNQRIVDVVTEVAHSIGATPAQVSIAWTLACGDHVIPIPGTRKLTHLSDNAGAADIVLNAEALRALGEVPETVGSRY
ncbi:aldo/keto reductase [Rhodococcus sp. 1163]|uniref:aldo/keto reductase n=1 Tax=Rhodococcus sp. 1163 TaxID=1905289 RepID=UPI000A023901|nr:aldo/keto reductase [Rhodococcus sp. 1163]ORI19694.1 aldo/keto reductase [Rhodococcus sp. 1163]